MSWIKNDGAGTGVWVEGELDGGFVPETNAEAVMPTAWATRRGAWRAIAGGGS